MANSSPVDDILEFLRKNKFTKAEAALRTELGKKLDLNGVLWKLKSNEVLCSRSTEELSWAKELKEDGKAKHSRPSMDGLKDWNIPEASSREVIVREVECGMGGNGSDSNWKTCGKIGQQRMVDVSIGTSDNNFDFFESSDDTILDLYSSKYSVGNGLLHSFQNDLGFQVSGDARLNLDEARHRSKDNAKPREDGNVSGEDRMSWPVTVNKATAEPKNVKIDKLESKELDQKRKSGGACSKYDGTDNLWSGSDAFAPSASEHWKDCSVETIFTVPGAGTSLSYDGAATKDKREGKQKTELAGISKQRKDHVDNMGRAFNLGNTRETELKNCSVLEVRPESEKQKEGLPRLAPVRLKNEDKSINIHWEEKHERRGELGLKIPDADNPYVIGPFLDVPISQEINVSGDGLSESAEFPNEYWDSDEYEDDDDVGYTRQPIEDETWFLAHEIDYPSDNDKGTGHGSVPNTQERERNNNDEDDQSFTEGYSYFSGEQYFQLKNIDRVVSSGNPGGLCATEIYQNNNENEMVGQYNGRLMDEEELNLICSEPAWQDFLARTNELALGDGKVISECGRPRTDDPVMDDDQHGSLRSIGVGVNSDVAELGSEARESLTGDIEYFPYHDTRIVGSRHLHHDLDKNMVEQSANNYGIKRHNTDTYKMNNDEGNCTQSVSHMDGGFSFPASRDEQVVETCSRKSLWSNKVNNAVDDEAYGCGTANDEMFTSRRSKNNDDSLLVKSSRDANYDNAGESGNSSPSSLSNSGYIERELLKKEDPGKPATLREEGPEALLEDDEAAVVQEQVKQIKAQEEEFETFNLKIVHRKNRTGFEEDKNFNVNVNSVIAGRYHVTEYLGSAAFSKAIQAHDLHTGIDVCVKIIKNNKDFFDQSLDEVKLLKYVNKHDPADKYHLLRLYDYFYYREHLLIVCELLKANLYEFQKFNRESGGEVYFTMPRLQSITIQCLEALQFLHNLGLIHCDLKPENILVKSYSRCEVKVIDLGSSCFETDNLCTYVQSRSYRAPEVILGLPYDKRIDIWSLGCILAELCTGNVLFQNDSPATLLARVVGIVSPIEAEMLAKGRDTHKYFTKNHMLYERNQETNRLEYLIPKKSSLRHRLSMGDQGFVEFVTHLLEVNPRKRPSASEALKHPWLQYPYTPPSS